MDSSSRSHTLRDAAVALAADDLDQAELLNGIGYNGQDTKFGNRIALLPEHQWTDAIRREAWLMLRKYKVQLAAKGIDYDAIPEPADVATRSLTTMAIGNGLTGSEWSARQDARRLLKENTDRALRRVRREADWFILDFPFNPTVIDAVKLIPGRSWSKDTKQWWVPLRSAAFLKDLAATHGFTLDSESERAMRSVQPMHAVARERRIGVQGTAFLFTFEYDVTLVNQMQNMPGRKYDGDLKAWIVPFVGLGAQNVDDIIQFAKRNGFGISEDAEAELARVGSERHAALVASSAMDTDVALAPVGAGKYELRPFQRAGAAYALKTKRLFIGDEVGLGKTVQAIATIETARAFPAVVVTKASLIYGWVDEIKKWTPDRRVLLLAEQDRADALSFVGTADYIVTTYDGLSDRKAADGTKRPGWADALSGVQFRSIVCDESQQIKTASAARTKAVRKIAKGTEYRLFTTATAIQNRPKELVSQLQILGRLDEFGGYMQFVKRYCDAVKTRWGWDADGNAHLLELNQRLRSICYVRREKKDVMPELPDVQVVPVPLAIDNRAEYDKAQASVSSWLAERAREAAVDEGADDAEAAAASAKARAAAWKAEALVRIGTLRQLSARGKLGGAKQWLTDFMESGEKIIVFAVHREIIDEVCQTFGAKRITGSESSKQRADVVRQFQTDPSCRMVVCNILAAGEGLTMTAAKHIVFLEMEWKPTAQDQAIGRAYGRLNDAHGVTAYYLVGRDTIDEWMVELNESKRDVVRAALTGVGADEAESVSMLEAIQTRLLKAA